MAFDGVPWAVTGSQLDTFVMREFAGIATRFAQGIALPGDFKCTPPGGNSLTVNVAGGGAVIRNAQAAGQSYIGYAQSSTGVTHSATGGSVRSDLIIARVRDPDFSPWTAYSDPNQVLFGPYFEPFIVAGVPSTTTKASQVVSYSALALARVDIPININGSSNGITSGMIVDLRPMANARTAVVKTMQAATVDTLTTGDTTYRTFPSGNSLSVTVPDWATHCMASVRILSVVVNNVASDLNGRIKFDNGAGTTVTGTAIQFDYNGNAGDNFSQIAGVPFEIFADINVTSLQGQTVTVTPQAQRTFVTNTGLITFNTAQQIVYDLTFLERTL